AGRAGQGQEAAADHPVSDAASSAGLERIRSRRLRPERDLSLRDIFDGELRRVRSAARATTGAAGAWEELLATSGLPPGLRERTRVVSFRHGVLTVRAADASTKYAVDRFMRAGGEAALARLAPATLRRVKIVL